MGCPALSDPADRRALLPPHAAQLWARLHYPEQIDDLFFFPKQFLEKEEAVPLFLFLQVVGFVCLDTEVGRMKQICTLFPSGTGDRGRAREQAALYCKGDCFVKLECGI